MYMGYSFTDCTYKRTHMSALLIPTVPLSLCDVCLTHSGEVPEPAPAVGGAQWRPGRRVLSAHQHPLSGSVQYLPPHPSLGGLHAQQ